MRPTCMEINMRMQELLYHMEQQNRLRAKLQDFVNLPEQIRKPYGMRTKVFQGRLVRLSRHERAFGEKLVAGLRRSRAAARRGR